jgi:hypothetical protein
VTAPVVGDRAIAIGREEEQLLVPGVGVEWPTVTEDDRLTRSPILVKDLRSIFGRDSWHVASLRLEIWYESKNAHNENYA